MNTISNAEYLRRLRMKQMGGDTTSASLSAEAYFDTYMDEQMLEKTSEQDTKVLLQKIRNQQIANTNQGFEETVANSQNALNDWQKFQYNLIDFGYQINKGFWGFFEGLGDLIIGGLGAIGTWFGASDQWAKDAIEYDWSSKVAQVGAIWQNGLWSIGLDDAYNFGEGENGKTAFENTLQENNWKQQVFGEQGYNFVSGVEYSIGNMLPSIALGALTGGAASASSVANIANSADKIAKAVSVGTMSLSAAGRSTDEALKEGASIHQALLYGVLSGGVEALSEYALELPLNKIGEWAGKATGNIVKLLPNSVGGALGQVAIGGVGKRITSEFIEEGLEEVFSDLLNPLIKSVYKGDIESNYKELFSKEGALSLLESFLAGGISSGVMGGGDLIGKYGLNYNAMQAGTFAEAIAQDYQDLVEGQNGKILTPEQAQTFLKNQAKNIEQYNKHLNRLNDKQKANLFKKLTGYAGKGGIKDYFNDQISEVEKAKQEAVNKLLDEGNPESVVVRDNAVKLYDEKLKNLAKTQQNFENNYAKATLDEFYGGVFETSTGVQTATNIRSLKNNLEEYVKLARNKAEIVSKDLGNLKNEIQNNLQELIKTDNIDDKSKIAVSLQELSDDLGEINIYDNDALNQSIDKAIQNLNKDSAVKEMVVRHIAAKTFAQTNLKTKIVFKSAEEMKQYSNNKDTVVDGFYNAKENTVYINSENSEDAAIFAHEYISHIILDELNSETVRERAQKIRKQQWFKDNEGRMTVEARKDDSEVVAHYLENLFYGNQKYSSEFFLNEFLTNNKLKSLFRRMDLKINKASTQTQFLQEVKKAVNNAAFKLALKSIKDTNAKVYTIASKDEIKFSIKNQLGSFLNERKNPEYFVTFKNKFNQYHKSDVHSIGKFYYKKLNEHFDNKGVSIPANSYYFVSPSVLKIQALEDIYKTDFKQGNIEDRIYAFNYRHDIRTGITFGSEFEKHFVNEQDFQKGLESLSSYKNLESVTKEIQYSKKKKQYEFFVVFKTNVSQENNYANKLVFVFQLDSNLGIQYGEEDFKGIKLKSFYYSDKAIKDGFINNNDIARLNVNVLKNEVADTAIPLSAHSFKSMLTELDESVNTESLSELKKSEKVSAEMAKKIVEIEQQYAKELGIPKEEIYGRFEEKNWIENDNGDYLSKKDVAYVEKRAEAVIDSLNELYNLTDNFNNLTYKEAQEQLLNIYYIESLLDDDFKDQARKFLDDIQNSEYEDEPEYDNIQALVDYIDDFEENYEDHIKELSAIPVEEPKKEEIAPIKEEKVKKIEEKPIQEVKEIKSSQPKTQYFETTLKNGSKLNIKIIDDALKKDGKIIPHWTVSYNDEAFVYLQTKQEHDKFIKNIIKAGGKETANQQSVTTKISTAVNPLSVVDNSRIEEILSKEYSKITEKEMNEVVAFLNASEQFMENFFGRIMTEMSQYKTYSYQELEKITSNLERTGHQISRRLYETVKNIGLLVDYFRKSLSTTSESGENIDLLETYDSEKHISNANGFNVDFGAMQSTIDSIVDWERNKNDLLYYTKRNIKAGNRDNVAYLFRNRLRELSADTYSINKNESLSELYNKITNTEEGFKLLGNKHYARLMQDKSMFGRYTSMYWQTDPKKNKYFVSKNNFIVENNGDFAGFSVIEQKGYMTPSGIQQGRVYIVDTAFRTNNTDLLADSIGKFLEAKIKGNADAVAVVLKISNIVDYKNIADTLANYHLIAFERIQYRNVDDPRRLINNNGNPPAYLFSYAPSRTKALPSDGVSYLFENRPSPKVIAELDNKKMKYEIVGSKNINDTALVGRALDKSSLALAREKNSALKEQKTYKQKEIVEKVVIKEVPAEPTIDPTLLEKLATDTIEAITKSEATIETQKSKIKHLNYEIKKRDKQIATLQDNSKIEELKNEIATLKKSQEQGQKILDKLTKENQKLKEKKEAVVEAVKVKRKSNVIKEEVKLLKSIIRTENGNITLPSKYGFSFTYKGTRYYYISESGNIYFKNESNRWIRAIKKYDEIVKNKKFIERALKSWQKAVESRAEIAESVTNNSNLVTMGATVASIRDNAYSNSSVQYVEAKTKGGKSTVGILIKSPLYYSMETLFPEAQPRYTLESVNITTDTAENNETINQVTPVVLSNDEITKIYKREGFELSKEKNVKEIEKKADLSVKVAQTNITRKSPLKDFFTQLQILFTNAQAALRDAYIDYGFTFTEAEQKVKQFRTTGNIFVEWAINGIPLFDVDGNPIVDEKTGIQLKSHSLADVMNNFEPIIDDIMKKGTSSLYYRSDIDEILQSKLFGRKKKEAIRNYITRQFSLYRYNKLQMDSVKAAKTLLLREIEKIDLTQHNKDPRKANIKLLKELKHFMVVIEKTSEAYSVDNLIKAVEKDFETKRFNDLFEGYDEEAINEIKNNIKNVIKEYKVKSVYGKTLEINKFRDSKAIRNIKRVFSIERGGIKDSSYVDAKLEQMYAEAETDVTEAQFDNFIKECKEYFSTNKDSTYYRLLNENTPENKKVLEFFNKEVERLQDMFAEPTNTRLQEMNNYLESIYGSALKSFDSQLTEHIKAMQTIAIRSNIISQEEMNFYNELFPNYVPIPREKIYTSSSSRGNVFDYKFIKTRQGSDAVIQPLLTSLGNQMNSILRRSVFNKVFGEFYTLSQTEEGKKVKSQHIQIDRDWSKERVTDANNLNYMDELTNAEIDNNTIIYNIKDSEGKIIQKKVTLSDQALAGVQNNLGDTIVNLEQVLNKFKVGGVNSVYKKLVTSWNPFFMFTNAVKDFSDAIFTTKNGSTKFIKEYTKSWAEALHGKSKMWAMFLTYGGKSASLLGYDTALDLQNEIIKYKKRQNTFNKIVEFVPTMNELIELMPRFTEFKLSFENYIAQGIDTDKALTMALYDSANITTDFSRGGSITKVLNRTIIPFLNAQVQGFCKAANIVMHPKDLSALVMLLVKMVMLGMLPDFLEELLYANNEDYQAIPEYTKENYFLIQASNGNFIKIPKGHILGVVASLGRQIINIGSGKADVKEGAETFIEAFQSNLSPVDLSNGLRTIFTPIADVKRNMTWYGGTIDKQSDLNKAPNERYDKTTSQLAIAIAKLNSDWSPKRVEYFLEQYTGVIGDILLPMTSSESDLGKSIINFINSNTTISAVKNNKYRGDFYDYQTKMLYAKNDGDDKAAIVYSYLTRSKNELEELEAQVDTAKDDEERYTAYITLREGYKTAIQNAQMFYEKLQNIEVSSDDRFAMTEAYRQVFGAEQALKYYSKSVYERSVKANNFGVAFDDFYQLYFSVRESGKKAVAYKMALRVTHNKARAYALLKLLGIVLSEQEMRQAKQFLD